MYGRAVPKDTIRHRVKMRIKQRLKIAWNVLFAKNFAYFQYDRAEFWEFANTTVLKNAFHIISPNKEDDINDYFANVVLKNVNDYLKERK